MSDKNWIRGGIPHILPYSNRIDLGSISGLGSCFSRNIYRWLQHHGVTHTPNPWGIFYNPFSILQELKRIILFDQEWKNNVIIQKEKTKIELIDPWRTWLIANSIEGLTEYNNRFDERAKRHLISSKTILITYGLAEVWKKDTNLYLNNLPAKSIARNKIYKEYTCEIASQSDLINAMSETILLINTFLGFATNIILTLSPIPLKFTFSNRSVREANNISKAKLLCAINDVCNSHNNVLYFPSYELVQGFSESDYSKVWQLDDRHITASSIDLIATEFAKFCRYETVKSTQLFSVPMVDKRGVIIGDIYSDGSYI